MTIDELLAQFVAAAMARPGVRREELAIKIGDENWSYAMLGTFTQGAIDRRIRLESQGEA